MLYRLDEINDVGGRRILNRQPNQNPGPLPPGTGSPVPRTGGPLPPLQTTTTAPPMSGPNPPQQVPTAPPMSTGLPPTQATPRPAPPMSTGLPPSVANTPPPVGPIPNAGPAPTLPGIDGNQFVANGGNGVPTGNVADIIKQLQAAFPQVAQQDPNAIINAAINAITGNESPLMARARQQGLEFANQRGLLNSNLAAGAAQGAALDRAMPLIQESLGITNRREGEQFQARQNAIQQGMALTGQREQQAFAGQQAQLDRVQGVNNALLQNQIAERQAALANYYSKDQASFDAQLRSRLQSDQTAQQDWLNDRNYTREFNGALSMLPIQNVYQMSQMIQQYALENPEVYTPQVIAGMTNFFQQNLYSILAQYFPSLVQQGG